MSRLVPSPVFLISSIRSGSTLLRCILGTHTKIHAPHELHLTELRVQLGSTNAQRAATAAELDTCGLEHLLWDRVIHASLLSSGKDQIVEKTPGNALAWRQLVACWPNARFMFLIRHPANVYQSALEANPVRPPMETLDIVQRLMEGVEDARSHLVGPTVRYEDLTADPSSLITAVCAYLGVDFEPAMLKYDVPDQPMIGIGDYTATIQTGHVLPGRALPSTVTPELARLCDLWGYPYETR